jgi:hypothetical protein
MALGGLLTVTDKRYRRRSKLAVGEKVGKASGEKAVDILGETTHA